MSIIDGTVFNSYHLGEDAAEKSMDKYVIVNNTLADILGRMNTKEVFCQWSVHLYVIVLCFLQSVHVDKLFSD